MWIHDSINHEWQNCGKIVEISVVLDLLLFETYLLINGGQNDDSSPIFLSIVRLRISVRV